MADDTHRHIIRVSYGSSTCLTPRFPIPVHLCRLFLRVSMCGRHLSLPPGMPSGPSVVCCLQSTGERQKVQNANLDGVEATC